MASLIGRISRIFLAISVGLALGLSTMAAIAAPEAAYVMDARSGETLYEKNAYTRLHPASLTKMMTLYIAFEEISRGRISLDSKVTVSKHAAAQPPSHLGLKPGQKIALRYLIRAAAVKSANDAATAIGEFIGGSEQEFAKRMTRTAKAIGMTDTTFRNANGLTASGHLSTARDMSVLGRRLFYDFPQYYNIFSRRTADAGMAQVRNTNSRFLDAYDGADGIKTGYTNAAGFNLTASAQRGNKRIIATVLGGSSTANRNARMTELLDMGFGLAPRNTKEKKPEPPTYDGVDDAVIAALEDVNGIDVPNAKGGAGKTVRVSGEVRKSLWPKARPAAFAAPATLPDDMAIAIAEGVTGALAEAAAPPPPEGTLESQAAAIVAAAPAGAGPAVAETDTSVALALVEPAPAGTLEAQATALAKAPAPGTFEAQVAALAEGAAAAETPLQEAQLPKETVLVEVSADPALAAFRPRPRSEAVAFAASEAARAVAVEIAEATPLAEVVLTSSGEDAAPATDLATVEAEGLTADLTGVEQVAGAVLPQAEAAPLALAAAILPLPRRTPIFDSVPAEEIAAADPEQEVVLRVSSSGSRHFGVRVGSFTSRGEAETMMMRTALAESATLHESLRKVTEHGGAYSASFLGLSEGEADLACRRLFARAIPCETMSP